MVMDPCEKNPSGEHCNTPQIWFAIWITCGSGHSSKEESDRATYGGERVIIEDHNPLQ